MTNEALTPPLDAPASPDTTGLGWPEFERRLAASLASLPALGYLVVATPGIGESQCSRYVQFAREEEGLLAEAVSNHSLDEGARLGPEQDLVLECLGWDMPSRPARHEHNWTRSFDIPVPFGDVAALAVRTLREVYEVAQPADLTYKRFMRGGTSLPDPELGLQPRPADAPASRGPEAWQPAVIDAVVEGVVTDVADPEHLRRPAQGTWVLATGGQVLRVVRLPSVPPAVRVWTVVLTGVEPSDGLLWTMNDANRELTAGRVLWDEGNVIVAVEVSVAEDWEQQLRLACLETTSLAQRLLGRFIQQLPAGDGLGRGRSWLH